jgi:hypothetical protein
MMKKNDKRIETLLAKAAEMRSNLGERPKVSYKTNAVFRFDAEKYININVADMDMLIDAVVFLRQKSNYHDEACEELGIDPIPEIVHWGYSVEDWTEDFKTRAALLRWGDRKQELDRAELKLEKLLSDEAKTAKELDEIEDLF